MAGSRCAVGLVRPGGALGVGGGRTPALPSSISGCVARSSAPHRSCHPCIGPAFLRVEFCAFTVDCIMMSSWGIPEHAVEIMNCVGVLPV
jgi:hypothetical protein